MTDTAQLEQRSLDWRMARCGAVTASKVGDIIKTNQNGKFSAKRANYFDAILAERMTGKPQDWKEVASLTARADMEVDARACYTFYTGTACDLVGFVQHPTIPNAGASPDAILGQDGMLEIKCLDPANHIKLLSGDASVMHEYLPQMQFGLACTERAWGDFMSFCPTMKDEGHRKFIRRVLRDDPNIAAIESAVRTFLAEVDRQVEALSR